MAKNKEYTCLLVETDSEGITWVTFNRPEKRNAMNPTLHVEMEQILFELETDEDTKVIVLTGAGNSRSAGMDLKQYFRETDKAPVRHFRANTTDRSSPTDILNRTRKPPIPMLASDC
jgi:trans-feruloyl-CoA hydratase/vanillin synthase